MLAANGLMEALLRSDSTDEYKDSNDDYDFGRVLEFCGATAEGKKNSGRMIRYSDGEERAFSF